MIKIIHNTLFIFWIIDLIVGVIFLPTKRGNGPMIKGPFWLELYGLICYLGLMAMLVGAFIHGYKRRPFEHLVALSMVIIPLVIIGLYWILFL